MVDYGAHHRLRNLSVDCIPRIGGNTYQMLDRSKKRGAGWLIVDYVRRDVLDIGDSTGGIWQLSISDICSPIAQNPPRTTGSQGLDLFHELLVFDYLENLCLLLKRRLHRGETEFIC